MFHLLQKQGEFVRIIFIHSNISHNLFCSALIHVIFLKNNKNVNLPTVVRSILSRSRAMATMIKTIFLDSLQPENQVAQGHPEITSPTAVISLLVW